MFCTKDHCFPNGNVCFRLVFHFKISTVQRFPLIFTDFERQLNDFHRFLPKTLKIISVFDTLNEKSLFSYWKMHVFDQFLIKTNDSATIFIDSVTKRTTVLHFWIWLTITAASCHQKIIRLEFGSVSQSSHNKTLRFLFLDCETADYL